MLLSALTTGCKTEQLSDNAAGKGLAMTTFIGIHPVSAVALARLRIQKDTHYVLCANTELREKYSRMTLK